MLYATVTVVLVYRWTVRRERTWLGPYLEAEVNRGTVTADEMALLCGSPDDRKAAVKAAKETHGHRAAKATEHLFESQYDLAAALGRTGDLESDDVIEARAEVDRQRQRVEQRTG